MKFGLMVVQNTDNIGDDIQSYAASKFLPQIDFFIDREKLDSFYGDGDSQRVAVIMNAWYMYTKFNWPPSPYIYPLFIAMHISIEDYYGIGTKFLDGLGGEYLKKYAPIGARDQSTHELLTGKGIESYISGCLTLTLDQFADVKKTDTIYLVDIEENYVKKIKEFYPNECFEEITHFVDYTDKCNYKERMEKVEELLKKYQGAKCVITSRLHCALPCLALKTSVLLLYKDEFKDRIEYFLKYIYSVSPSDVENNNMGFDISNPPRNKEDYLLLRENIKEKCNDFIVDCKNKTIKCEDINFFDVLDWQDNLINESELKFREQILEYKSWCEELQQGKNWLESEYNSLKVEHEKIKVWCDDQQQGKDWLEREYEKLKIWCEELQQGKDWIENEWKNKCKECEELKEALKDKLD